MKYIKRFENIEFKDPYDEYINKLRKFCVDHLAYLIDEGFSISIKDNKVAREPIRIDIEPVSSFKWREVKYDIIQFLEFLSKNYELIDEPIELHEDTAGIYTYQYTLFDVINDTGDFTQDGYNDDSNDISYISIYVKQPKPIGY
jgi:hypothetical protein